MLNKKGGYQLISLLGIVITTLTAVPGIYERLVKSHGKPILVTDINVGGSKQNDIFVTPKLVSGDYVLENVYGYDLTIDDDDSIVVTEHSGGTAVVANPTGSLSAGILKGLQIGTDKYKVNALYKHVITGSNPGSLSIITSSPTACTTMESVSGLFTTPGVLEGHFSGPTSAFGIYYVDSSGNAYGFSNAGVASVTELGTFGTDTVTPL